MIWPPSRSYQRSASSRASASCCSLRLRDHHMSQRYPVLSHRPGTMWTMTVALLVIALVIGVALGWLAARLRSASEVARLDATLRATRDGEERLTQSLRSL